ncbi:tetratricopeptide repeat protein [Pontibacter harenae]|uniref:tetratricopeptide repeat protein n=1 Tax=Pontibacter harenae TaxID=2894083 RepID=UPI001E3197DE|nr:hypothetical protein [Pontibacter harenae]MCC9165627.1 hypothetical protein [Pontibacter harenae]
MKKLFFAAAALLFSATMSFAQEQPAQPDPKVLPMFGKQAKTEQQQLQDERFLSSCDKSFANRQEASKFFLERGWEYYNEGQLDTAVYRFNLAWLLNPDNSDAYWAFGLVSNTQGKVEDAIGFFEKALVYTPNNSMLLSDVASSYLTLYNQKPKKKKLKKAASYAEKALSQDANNAYALLNLSQIKYFKKDYAEAWSYFHKGRALDLRVIDYSYVTLLMEKMPDPDGFFKSTAPSGETAAQ